jgi:hypothetical protein
MEQDIAQYGQMNFTLPHDMVVLPSGGIFYKSKKKSVKVGYLTASDENILIGAPKNNTEGVVLSLLRNKLYESDLRPEELLTGDIEAILIFLRNTAFGPEYEVSLTDPKTDRRFPVTILLDELNIKKTEIKPNEEGTFIVKLPKTGSEVKLKPISLMDSLDLEKMANDYPSNRVAPKVTWRLNKQIISVDNNTDRGYIAKFIESLPIADSKFIRNFLNDNEPRLDLQKEVTAPSGEKVIVDITFGVEFFRPFY